MKHQYQIVSSFDPTDIPVDSKWFMKEGKYGDQEWQGWDQYGDAVEAGEVEMMTKGYNPSQYYVKVYEVTTSINIEE